MLPHYYCTLTLLVLAHLCHGNASPSAESIGKSMHRSKEVLAKETPSEEVPESLPTPAALSVNEYIAKHQTRGGGAPRKESDLVESSSDAKYSISSRRRSPFSKRNSIGSNDLRMASSLGIHNPGMEYHMQRGIFEEQPSTHFGVFKGQRNSDSALRNYMRQAESVGNPNLSSAGNIKANSYEGDTQTLGLPPHDYNDFGNDIDEFSNFNALPDSSFRRPSHLGANEYSIQTNQNQGIPSHSFGRGNSPVIGQQQLLGQSQLLGGHQAFVGGHQQLLGGQLQSFGGSPSIGGHQQILGGHQQILGGHPQLMGSPQPIMGGSHPLMGGHQSILGQQLGGRHQSQQPYVVMRPNRPSQTSTEAPFWDSFLDAINPMNLFRRSSNAEQEKQSPYQSLPQRRHPPIGQKVNPRLPQVIYQGNPNSLAQFGRPTPSLGMRGLAGMQYSQRPSVQSIQQGHLFDSNPNQFAFPQQFDRQAQSTNSAPYSSSFEEWDFDMNSSPLMNRAMKSRGNQAKRSMMSYTPEKSVIYSDISRSDKLPLQEEFNDEFPQEDLYVGEDGNIYINGQSRENMKVSSDDKYSFSMFGMKDDVEPNEANRRATNVKGDGNSRNLRRKSKSKKMSDMLKFSDTGFTNKESAHKRPIIGRPAKTYLDTKYRRQSSVNE